jgi:hypothetical protein
MHITLRNILLVVVLGSGAALAAEKSYMALVGELAGFVESPRLVRDYCAARSPATASANARLYDDWKARHKALLDAIEEQIGRANLRLKRQGAPGGDNPIAAMLATAPGLVEEQLAGMTTSQLKTYCGSYASLIKTKDAEASTSIPRLLEVVANADQVMSARERT